MTDALTTIFIFGAFVGIVFVLTSVREHVGKKAQESRAARRKDPGDIN